MIYVDSLGKQGFIVRGQHVKSCHMWTDGPVEELHEFAQRIGLKRSWFQHRPGGLPHYDIVQSMHSKAVAEGALQVGRKKAVGMWRILRAAARATT